jgi:hypothetical protein
MTSNFVVLGIALALLCISPTMTLDRVTIRGLLQAEQAATAADRQKMLEAVEEARAVTNRVLDGLVELLRGSMDERVASVETVIGSPT